MLLSMSLGAIWCSPSSQLLRRLPGNPLGKTCWGVVDPPLAGWAGRCRWPVAASRTPSLDGWMFHLVPLVLSSLSASALRLGLEPLPANRPFWCLPGSRRPKGGTTPFWRGHGVGEVPRDWAKRRPRQGGASPPAVPPPGAPLAADTLADRQPAGRRRADRPG